MLAWLCTLWASPRSPVTCHPPQWMKRCCVVRVVDWDQYVHCAPFSHLRRNYLLLPQFSIQLTRGHVQLEGGEGRASRIFSFLLSPFHLRGRKRQKHRKIASMPKKDSMVFKPRVSQQEGRRKEEKEHKRSYQDERNSRVWLGTGSVLVSAVSGRVYTMYTHSYGVSTKRVPAGSLYFGCLLAMHVLALQGGGWARAAWARHGEDTRNKKRDKSDKRDDKINEDPPCDGFAQYLCRRRTPSGRGDGVNISGLLLWSTLRPIHLRAARRSPSAFVVPFVQSAFVSAGLARQAHPK